MIRAAVIGASGYSGAELLRLLALREDVEITTVTARTAAGRKVHELYPQVAGHLDLAFEELMPGNLSSRADVAFVALPSGEAMKIVPELLEAVGRVVDLGGDFRLPSPAVYKAYYRHDHTAPELLAEAVYGLPELNGDAICRARLVANPGCYPTSALLALLPAVTQGVIHPSGIVINSLSGVSGAGRSASVELSFSEVNENLRAYKIGTHQHIPEIHHVLERAAASSPRAQLPAADGGGAGGVSPRSARPKGGAGIGFSFVPHIVPITRGIYTTIHADIQGAFTEAELYDLYETFYASAPFVRVGRTIPEIRGVARTNYCDLHIAVEPRTNRLVIISAIDNLMKGAAGQAVQNMNIMFGCPQVLGLR